MKTISVLLAFFILGLISIPCSDTDASSDQLITEVSSSYVDQATDLEVDFCSPFCTCHCCHTHLIPHGQNTSEVIVYAKDTGETLYEKEFSGPSFPIFQPPKV